MDHIDVALAERAQKQLGLQTLPQLIDLGLTRSMRRTRLADRRLIQVSSHVFRHHAFPVTWHQRVLAAVLEAGPGAAASHMAAAALWGFDGIGTGAVELVVPRDRRPRGITGRLHWPTDLRTDDIDASVLIRRTTPIRTLLDIAPRLTTTYLAQAVDHGCRDGLFDPDAILQRMASDRRRGKRRLDGLADLLPGARAGRATESWLESRTLRIYAAAGMPLPRTQVHVDGATGRVMRVDFLFEDARLVIEVMGHRTHSTRQQRRDDAERRSELILLGYEVIEFTYEQVRYQPDYVAATTAAHLALRTRATSGR